MVDYLLQRMLSLLLRSDLSTSTSLCLQHYLERIFPTSVLHLQSLFIFNLYFVQFPVQRFPPWIIYAISVRQYWTRRLAPWPQMIRLIPRLIHWEKTWWSPKENTFNEIETLLRLFEKGNKLTCRIFRTFFKIFGNKFEIFGKKTREFPETYSGEYKWYLSPVIEVPPFVPVSTSFNSSTAKLVLPPELGL